MDFEKNITKSYMKNQSLENQQLVKYWRYTFLLLFFLSIEEMAVTNRNNHQRLFLKVENSEESVNICTMYFFLLLPDFTCKPLPKIFYVRTRTFLVCTQDFTCKQALTKKHWVRKSTRWTFFHSFVYNSVERILSLFYKLGILSNISER